MEHNLFKPHSFEEGKHAVVGDCNGFTMQQRWDAETPLFAKAILQNLTQKRNQAYILDYGCGVGRLAKEVLKQHPNDIQVVGVDASEQMCKEAVTYVANPRFNSYHPTALEKEIEFDLAYCVYVLQHVPSIEIREILARIHSHLKDDGVFVYCSSDYRMAIRFDDGGFFDDRFMGINLQEEVERLFEYQGELFDQVTLESNPILKTMIVGGLPHPAKVYKKRPITDYLHIKKEATSSVEAPVDIRTLSNANTAGITKLLLVNRLAPGDILVMTNAIRDLHKAYPGKYQTEVRTPCNPIFENNPYCTKLNYDEAEYQKKESELHKGDKDGHTFAMGDILVIDMQYPLIHRSGAVGAHFCEGHRDFLETVLGYKIPQTELTPEIYLTQTEREWLSPIVTKTSFHGKYWLINAGGKGDFTLKQYPYYQEVVDLLKDKVQFIQIGQLEHNHPALNGVIDLRGKTNVRELFRATYHAQGVLTCVSFPMHIAAAFKKPCVVVAGAREGTRWELYPNQQFLYVNGCLPCATYDGCWKSKQEDCNNKVDEVAKCLTLIKPSDVANAVLRYYEGGMLTK